MDCNLQGAVVHDNGDYGMLGFGHGPEKVMGNYGGKLGNGQCHDSLFQPMHAFYDA